jgi:glyoxylase-like metal-dependent hydrolase (beta-lactamase superfamily II)
MRNAGTPTIAVALAAVSLAVYGVVIEARGSAARQPAAGVASIEVLQLRPNVFMLAGANGNVTVQTGEDGAVVVDAGPAATAAAVVDIIRKISPRPTRYVINTSADPDHVGGNEAVAKAGETLFVQRSFGLPNDFLGGGAASILAAEQVLTRMSAASGERQAFPVAAWPTETFDYARKYMYLNGEGIEVLHQPAAHSDGDSIVFFRRSDVIAAGDIVDMRRLPVIDVARGGTIDGEIAALNRLVGMAIPSVPIVSREAGTLVVPGHGRVLDQIDVVHYRDMVTIIRDRVRDLKAAGMTLEQVRATSPARGYLGRFGATTGPWTTNDFIDAVYRTAGLAKS